MNTRRGISLIGLMALISLMIASAAIAQQDESPLRVYCNTFNDLWFDTMQYSYGFCYPGTWGDIRVTRADAEFGASLSIGWIGEGESIADMDEQFQTDSSGRNLLIGTKRTVEATYEEFVEVPLGNFATRKVLNTWEVVLDPNANGKFLGNRQNVSITYIVRQGRCYATLGVHGEGPMESKLFFDTIAPKAEQEATQIAKKMKDINLCGSVKLGAGEFGIQPTIVPTSPHVSGTGPSVVPPASTPTPAPAPAEPPVLPQPTKEEIEQWIKENIPDYVPPPDEKATSALVPTSPTDEDLVIPPEPAEPKIEQPYYAVVEELDGTADMKLSDGTWVAVEVGMVVPEGATINAGYAATVLLRFSDHLVIYMRSLEEVNIIEFRDNPGKYRRELKLETGELRFKVLEGTLKTDMKVSTPNAQASIVGTDFAMAYNSSTDMSVVEVYDGSVAVAAQETGETKTIATKYGSAMKRIEIGSDNTMVEKLAIPKDDWEMLIAGRAISQKLWPWVVIGVILLVGVGFLMYKRGLFKK